MPEARVCPFHAFGVASRTLPRLALAVIVGACTAPPSPADPAVLLSADSAFDAAVADGGVAAWVDWFAEDGAMIQPGVGEVRGSDAIRDIMAGLDDPATSLRWSPMRADIAASGELGWTTGRWVSTTTDVAGTTTRSEGRYVTIWRRQADGSWKVVMDLGNPVGPSPGA